MSCWSGCLEFLGLGRQRKLSLVGQDWASPVPRDEVEVNVACPGEIGSLDLDDKLRRSDLILKQNALSKFQVEQLIMSPGRLPKALSPAARDEAIEELLPSATRETLQSLPSEVLSAATPDGQALRRRTVNGATVVFFTAGYAGKRFVFERAAALGIKSVVIEHPDSWAKDLVREGLIAKFIPMDMSRSSDVILDDALTQVKSLGADGLTGPAEAVTTFVELSVPLVARLCERLGLPGPLPDAVDAARDKHATRAALKRAGLPTPKNMLIHSEADITAAAEHVGFPAVLKPISGAASLGVKKVTSVHDIHGCYREIVSELSSLVVVSGALVQNDGSDRGISAGSIIDMTILMEQYLDGNEVDVDVVVSDGSWRYAAVTDNGPTVEPYFNETWGVCPSLLPVGKQRELKELATQSVAALGFDCGVFHVECKYTSSGPHLIECNARMGGGPVHEHNLQTWGVDLVEEAIFIALGIPARPAVPAAPLRACAYFLVPCKQSGTVQALPPNLEQLRGQPGCMWAKALVKPGDRVVGPQEGLPTWLCDIMVTRPKAKQALDFVLEWEGKNQVSIAASASA